MATANAMSAQFDRAMQHRRAMLGKINIARHQLAMDDDDYRQGLFDNTGKTSLKDCNEAQLHAMLDWLKSKGFKPLPGKARAQTPMAKKARALWISLHQLGVVHNPSEQALEAFARRQLGCERMVWARQSDAFRLIEALKSMAYRAGWKQHSIVTGKKLSPLELQESLCWLILGKLKTAGAVPDDWQLHHAMWRLCGIENSREQAWTAEDYERLAIALGAKLRELAPQQGDAA